MTLTGDVDVLLAEVADRHQLLGASLAVRMNGEDVGSVVGSAVCSDLQTVTQSTRFRIGSIMKVLTSSVLVDELGRAGVDLDENVSTLVGELDADGVLSQVSFRQLLRHQAGIDGVYWDGFGDNEDAVSRYASAASELGLIFTPGSSWAYSNSAYVLAGRAVEVLTGLDFATAIDERILAPSGAQQVSVYEPSPPQGAANGHYATGDGIRCADIPTGQRALAPIGAPAFGSAIDTLRACRYALATADPTVLLDNAIALPPSERDAATHQSLGWKLYRWGSSPLWGHDGGSSGQASFTRLDSDAETGVCFLSNTTPNALFAWSDISNWFLDAMGIEPPGAIPADHAVSVDPDDLGTYESRDATFIFMRDDDGHARIAVRTFGNNTGPTARLVPLQPNLYRSQYPIVDAYGLFSTETTNQGDKLLHAGPFTARRQVERPG